MSQITKFKYAKLRNLAENMKTMILTNEMRRANFHRLRETSHNGANRYLFMQLQDTITIILSCIEIKADLLNYNIKISKVLIYNCNVFIEILSLIQAQRYWVMFLTSK